MLNGHTKRASADFLGLWIIGMGFHSLHDRVLWAGMPTIR